MSREKNHEPIGKKIERLGAKISSACIFYDLTPGGNQDMSDIFTEFISLLIYCNEKKLYYERDSALKNIKFFMTME